jgi:hypothetical protein
MKVGVLVASLIFTLVAYAAQSQPKKGIIEPEAIRLAEEFIVDNGYTDMPPSEDKSKLKCESIDCGLDEWTMKNIRHNSLLRKAYGVLGNDPKKPGKGWWIIAFRYNCDHPEFRRTNPDWDKLCKTRGRAVMMDAYGNNLHMIHQECPLEFKGLRKTAQ